MGIDHREKNIIFSDSVNLDKALQLKKQCDELGFMCASLQLSYRVVVHLQDCQHRSGSERILQMISYLCLTRTKRAKR